MEFKKEFIQNLTNYLVSKPYSEVYHFISVISEELQKELGTNQPIVPDDQGKQEKPDA